MSSIIIRHGVTEDFESFLKAERIAWKKAPDVSLITREQFSAWLDVFPEGLWLAEYRGEICGHIFSQMCHFNPYDETDNRSWGEVTDDGCARRTHDSGGNTLYTVSVSASRAGAGMRLIKRVLTQAMELGLEYCAGACRVPGIRAHAEKMGQPIDSIASQYLDMVKSGEIDDGTLSVFLLAGIQLIRGIPGYFKDENSGDWGVLIVHHSR